MMERVQHAGQPVLFILDAFEGIGSVHQVFDTAPNHSTILAITESPVAYASRRAVMEGRSDLSIVVTVLLPVPEADLVGLMQKTAVIVRSRVGFS